MDWFEIDTTLLWWLAGGSVALFFATPLIIATLVVRIPSDYFAYAERHLTSWGQQHRWLRYALMLVKNLLGLLLLLAGIAMLVLPGQGIITILMGVLLLDIPGKYRFERWLVTRPAVWRAIGWLRHKAGRDPLVLEAADSGSE